MGKYVKGKKKNMSPVSFKYKSEHQFIENIYEVGDLTWVFKENVFQINLWEITIL